MLKPHTANLINGCVLIAYTAWAYLTSGFESWSVLIPGAFGVALLICTPGVKVENKVIAHVAVTLTLVIFLLLMVPLFKAIGAGDAFSTLRVTVMLVLCVMAMVAFIKSFRDARRRREG